MRTRPGSQSDVVPSMTGVLLAEALECFDHLAGTKHGSRTHQRASGRDFHFAGLQLERHATLCAHLKACLDRLSDILLRFFFGFALAHAARDPGAFGYEDTVFVRIDGDD